MASSTKTSHRAFALTMAILFFFTAFSFSGLVIYESLSNPSSSKSSSQSSAQQPSDKLAGTKLKGFTPVAVVKKLKITDLKKGSGAAIKSPKQTITVDYTGAVATSGVIFQSTLGSGQKFTTVLNKVIPGWQIGLTGMKVGSTRQLLIPAAEAYGANPPQGSGIPKNAPLVFNITLYKVGA
ncbi:MAG: FKBP-type peptidyl-prolyl cis-trans isomerase [Candidatus Saccharimonadales bacterium]